jgi:MFS family permease
MMIKKRLRLFTYLAAFCLNFHLALTAYVNSSFLAHELSEFLAPENIEFSVGLIYSLAFLISMLAVFRDEKAIIRYGDLSLTRIMILVLVGISILLGFTHGALMLIILFIAFNTLGAVIRFNLDVYLATLSTPNQTGRIRGTFLTVVNLAWLATPYLAGQLLGTKSHYALIYIIAGLSLLPMLYLSFFNLRERALPKEAQKTPQIVSTLLRLLRGRNDHDRDLRHILTIILLLNFFYGVMVVYTPIYLSTHLGFTWPQIGLIFSVMLLPFVLCQLPLGILADKIGEKTILVGGLITLGVSTIGLSFINQPSLALWAGSLFLTRVGAATLEVASDSYLFKRVGGRDLNIIALSRVCYSFASIIAPIAGAIFLISYPLQGIFIALGVVILLGLLAAYPLTAAR